jgi:hypothetical protein
MCAIASDALRVESRAGRYGTMLGYDVQGDMRRTHGDTESDKSKNIEQQNNL